MSKILVFPHCGSVLGYISKVSKLLPITHWGRSPNASNWRPIMAERPETVEALASAKPPPRRRTNDQGIFLWMASQVKRLGDGLDSEAKNRRKSLLLSTFVMKLKRSRYYAASAKDNGNYVRKSFQANWKYTYWPFTKGQNFSFDGKMNKRMTMTIPAVASSTDSASLLIDFTYVQSANLEVQFTFVFTNSTSLEKSDKSLVFT